MAARGQVLLQPDIASKVFSSLTLTSPIRSFVPSTDASSTSINNDVVMHVEQLTEREREILTLLVQGTSNRQIAEKLYLTEGTVKNHMSNILSKLGVRDRTQAALKAKELGLA